MTVLGLFNRVILQWFFVRLVKSLSQKGAKQWQLVGPALPFTGFKGPYKWLGRRRTLKLTNRREP